MSENVCQTSGFVADEEFAALRDEMKKDTYWIRFFVRPCCPAPSLSGARDLLDKLKGEVAERADFTDEQKAELSELIEVRKEWYVTSGLCRKRD